MVFAKRPLEDTGPLPRGDALAASHRAADGSAGAVPEYLPEDDFSPVARWIAGLKREGFPCVLRSYVSPAVRVAAAARDAGMDWREPFSGGWAKR